MTTYVAYLERTWKWDVLKRLEASYNVVAQMEALKREIARQEMKRAEWWDPAWKQMNGTK